MGKIIMCGSFKGGVGKSVTTFNLAYSLAEIGKKVLAVDFDSQANLTTCFGVEDVEALPITIGHLMMAEIEEESMPETVEYIHSRNGVDFIPSSMVLSAVDSKLRLEMGAEGMLSRILEPLRDSYDYILLDTCPSLGALTINALAVPDAGKGGGLRMKADAPKRKIFNDAVDLLSTGEQAPCGSGVEMLDIDSIKPFRHHPFHLYEEERLNDMVESIKEHGILNPVIVRKMHYGYEILSGHNRQNAAKLAGLKEIPAFVKVDLPDEDAYVYVIETNLMQRSFTDLSISEKAAVLAERYDKVLYQRKRDEIVAELKALETPTEAETEKGGHDVRLSKNRDNLGDEYGLSGRHVARLMRVNQCLPEIKEMLDQGKMQLTAAVQLSYLSEQGQLMALEVSEKSGINITEKIAKEIRKAKMTEKDIREAIAGPDLEINKLTGEPILPEEKPKLIRLSGDIRVKYFGETPQKEVEDIIDKALAAWFKKRR